MDLKYATLFLFDGGGPWTFERRDLGSHVANVSFMVSPAAQGMGVGKAMGQRCLTEARKAGYMTMQFMSW